MGGGEEKMFDFFFPLCFRGGFFFLHERLVKSFGVFEAICGEVILEVCSPIDAVSQMHNLGRAFFSHGGKACRIIIVAGWGRAFG